MRVELLSVSKGRNGEVLPETSAVIESGRVTLVEAETEQRPTVLALIASGRMHPDTGRIVVTPELTMDRFRGAAAVVDAPDVSEPFPDLPLVSVIREELMFAGKNTGRRSTASTLAEFDATEYSGFAMGTLPVELRVRALTELAVQRAGVEFVILTRPDRHGGDPFGWWGVCTEIAGRGIAVLVITGSAAATVITDSGERASWAPAAAQSDAESAGFADALADQTDDDNNATTVAALSEAPQQPHPLHAAIDDADSPDELEEADLTIEFASDDVAADDAASDATAADDATSNVIDDTIRTTTGQDGDAK